MPTERRTVRIICTDRGQHRKARLIAEEQVPVAATQGDPARGFRAPAGSRIGTRGYHWRCRCGRYDVVLRPENGYRVLLKAVAADLWEVDISYLQ